MVDARILQVRKRGLENKKVRPVLVMQFALAFRFAYCTRIR